MKTIKKVIEENSDYKVLINAVVSRIGKDSIEAVIKHGINGGYSGFIYCSDTHSFALRYRTLICKLLDELASEFGVDVIKMVSGFGVFRNSPMDSEDKKDLFKYLGGGRPEQGTITNTMAWFAAEEVCRMFDE
ncbi:MAG: hypothetical protein M0P47_09275 [Bacteroidales bacterium]|jgi:hypothetical protein|nr:hypothetical protein [Bacteroidales bacterium]